MSEQQPTLAEQLRVLADAATPVRPEEAMRSAVRRRRPTRIARRVAAAVVLFAAGGAVIWSRLSGPPGVAPLPAAHALSDSVIVASGTTVSLNGNSLVPAKFSGPALIAIDPADGSAVPVATVPQGSASVEPAFNITRLLGGDVVAIDINVGGNGKATAAKPGTRWQHALGVANRAVAAAVPDAVWLTTLGPSGGSGCTIREETSLGVEIRPAQPFPCSWTPLGTFDRQLVVAEWSTPSYEVALWNASSRATRRLFSMPDMLAGPPQLAGHLVVDTTSTDGCPYSCRGVEVGDLSSGRTYDESLGIAGMVLPWNEAPLLSPDGQLVAVVETPSSDAMYSSPLGGGVRIDGCAYVACGSSSPSIVAVFNAVTGQLLVERHLSLVDPGSTLEWSPDGSWIFVSVNNRSIDCVPAFSASAPVTTVELPAPGGSAALGSEDFVVAAAPTGR